MSVSGVSLITKIINKDDNAYSMHGFVNPTFQNLGVCPVYVNGILLEKGDSFGIDTNGLPLVNEISIQFANANDTRRLILNCLKKTEVQCNTCNS